MAYSVGERVNGIVSGITDYGVFLLFSDGSVGMIHISKLSTDYITDIRSFAKKGDSMSATVISSENGRIALSCIADKPKKRDSAKKPDFEAMLSSFKTASDERQKAFPRDNKRKRR